MSPAEVEALQCHVEAQQRLIHQLTATVEKLQQPELQGPDAATRRYMLELAGTVFSQASPIQKAYAGTLLADLVRKYIPAPRPVAVPSPVVAVEKESSC